MLSLKSLAARGGVLYLLIVATVSCSGPSSVLTMQPTPAPTSPAAPADVFVSAGSAGVEEFAPSNGALLSTTAAGLGVSDVALDDTGNVYVVSGSGGTNSRYNLARFAIGGSVPTATYTNNGSEYFVSAEVTPQGVLIAQGGSEASSTVFETIYEWQPGVTGTASATLDYSAELSEEFAGLPTVGADGTLYEAHALASASFGYAAGVAYDVLAPGTNALVREIRDSNGPNFRPYAMAVDAAGNLYVAEWNGSGNDPLAGIYIYSTTGTESAVHSGAPAPVSISIDDDGRVYVLNNNRGDGTDSSHTYSVYSPGMKSLLTRVSTGFVNGSDLTVSPDGTRSYFIGQPSPAAPSAVMEIAQGASTATVFAHVAASNIALFNGTRATVTP